MKKRVSVPLPALAALLAALTLSLAGHYFGFLYRRAQAETSLQIAGSYCTADVSVSVFGEYIVFAPSGSYMRYLQTGPLEEGTYEQAGEWEYTLTSHEGQRSQILLRKDGLYRFDGREAITRYTRFSSSLVYIEGSWPEEAQSGPSPTGQERANG